MRARVNTYEELLAAQHLVNPSCSAHSREAAPTSTSLAKTGQGVQCSVKDPRCSMHLRDERRRAVPVSPCTPRVELGTQPLYVHVHAIHAFFASARESAAGWDDSSIARLAPADRKARSHAPMQPIVSQASRDSALNTPCSIA